MIDLERTVVAKLKALQVISFGPSSFCPDSLPAETCQSVKSIRSTTTRVLYGFHKSCIDEIIFTRVVITTSVLNSTPVIFITPVSFNTGAVIATPVVSITPAVSITEVV